MGRIVLENVSKSFRAPGLQTVRALDQLSLSAEEGRFLVVLGPSGCGKSTLLRLIAGLEAPDQGSISMDGQSLAGVEPKDRDMAMVFQNYSLFPHLTVFENIGLGLRLRKFPRAQLEQRVRGVAEMLGLTALLDRRPATLSGGESQRVALGRAMAREPAVFLLDEPLSNLDAPMRLQLRAEIAKLRHRLARTMILVTHDQAEALALADTLAVLQEGRLQQAGAPMELYRRPANRFVAGFLGSPPMNFFQGTLARKNGGLWFVEKGPRPEGFSIALDDSQSRRLQGYAEKPVTLGLRPEHFFQASPGASSQGQAGWLVHGLLERIERAGAEDLLWFSTANHSLVARMLPGGMAWPEGRPAALLFQTSHACFFDAATGNAL